MRAAHRLIILLSALPAIDAMAMPTLAQDKLTRNELFELQFRLNQLGFDAGDPDGRSGPRTRAAIAAYSDSAGLSVDNQVPILEAARRAAWGLEGVAQDDGSIDLLVFTDEGTPLILTAIGTGIIHSDDGTSYIRDRDRNGEPIRTRNLGDVHLEETAEVPLIDGLRFGYAVRVPTPPPGERLQVDHVTTYPYRQEDGTTVFGDAVTEHIYTKAPSSSHRYWYWRFGADTPDKYLGDWAIRLENNGDVLISRSFEVYSVE